MTALQDPSTDTGASRGHVLITGGAGFIGANLADRLAASGSRVVIFDNLSRPGVQRNLDWLRERHGSRIVPTIADITDASAVRAAVRGAAQVFHLAAQVAVTTSLSDPAQDLEVNLRGTFNLLEALRAHPAPLVFTSTNKVYGNLGGLRLTTMSGRYAPADPAIRTCGIAEDQPLSFHSPYGCSKGAADQYALDYSRSFGLPTVVFRMSCIYGRRQMGTEDQGWVAHFALQAQRGEPITIYGDGQQVRDILYVDDLVDALLLAQAHMPALRGHAFNIGGGPSRAVSLHDVLTRIAARLDTDLDLRFEDWRIGDQKYYVSDTRRFERATGWFPRHTVDAGVSKLQAWLHDDAATTAASAGPPTNGDRHAALPIAKVR